MRICLTFLASIAFVLASVSSVQGAEPWRSIDPRDISSTTPQVERDADAEVLFWEVWLDDTQIGRTVFRHYLRVKVFTVRGVESQSRMDLPYTGKIKIADIAARTVKPDGTAIELKKDAIFERTIIKAGKIKVQAKSFVMPSVERGAILEYQWRQEQETLAQFVRLEFQREIPMRSVKYYIKPFTGAGFPYPMTFNMFNMANVPLEKEKSGYSSFTLTNVPAFKSEPYMPPEAEVRPWMLVFYDEPMRPNANQFWTDFGKRAFEADKSEFKDNDDIRRATASSIGTVTDPEQKLSKLFEFVRSKVVNPYDDASSYSEQELAKVKPNESPSDTLKRGVGTPGDISILFGAMASAAGFDVRIARLSDRSDVFFKPSLSNTYFLQSYDVAIRVGDRWRFFDPGSRYTPFGMLVWWEEGVSALLPDTKEPLWVNTPLSSAEKSLEKRTAHLRLQEDGTVEGDITIEYSGHLGSREKEYFDELTVAEQEEEVTKDVKNRLSTAQITEIKLENVKDPVKPVTLRYHLKVPQYAQRTGRRLFFQPGFFEKDVAPFFSDAERKFPLYFSYSWSEEDEVLLELPKGFALENAEQPGSLTFADIASLDIRIGAATDGSAIQYTRKFRFNPGGSIFPAATYANFKKAFDLFHQNDSSTLTLRETDVAR